MRLGWEYSCRTYPLEKRIVTVLLLRYLAVTSTKVREAYPAIWGVFQVLDGQNPILPHLSECSKTLLGLVPPVLEVLIKLTATSPGLLTIPQVL